MSHLHGALYGRVLRAVQNAKQTGDTTSVVLVQQKICVRPGVLCPPMLYHVGLVARSGDAKRVFEHGPIAYDENRFDSPLGDPTIFIPLPSVDNTIENIADFEAHLPTKYIIGIRDCRHHVLDLLHYLYD